MMGKEELINRANKTGAHNCIHFEWSINPKQQCSLFSTRDELVCKSCLLMQGKPCPSKVEGV